MCRGGGWGTETVHNIHVVSLPSFFSSPPFSFSFYLSHPSHPSPSTHPIPPRAIL